MSENSKVFISFLAILLSLFMCLDMVDAKSEVSLESTQAKPNVVLILSDDQAWTDYGFMGHKTIKTPRLDQLASESVLFGHGYVPTALCRPSLATIITGYYAHQHKICGNDPIAGVDGKGSKEYRERREELISHIDDFETLPALLAERGYVSHQSGKWWEGSYQRGGFTEGMTRGFPERNGRHGDDGLKIGRQGMQPIFDFMKEATQEKKPFFVWYAPFMPHEPHTPPERLLEKYNVEGRPLPIAKYYAMCEWFDETCGQLLDRIDELNQTENTLVIYVADNGWVQLPNKARGGYAPKSKQSPNEGGIRTPIMFKWPKVITPAKRPELCSSIDIMPTVLAATGTRHPKGLSAPLPGLNLMPALTEGDSIDRDAIYSETFSHDIPDLNNPSEGLIYRSVIEGQWKLMLTYDGRTTGFKYPPKDFRPKLYDLVADPFEEHNLALERPNLVKRLAMKIAEWWPVDDRNTLIE